MCCSEMLPLLLITAASAAEVPLASPWMDATLPVDKRVELILKQMTNAEKQAQTKSLHRVEGTHFAQHASATEKYHTIGRPRT